MKVIELTADNIEQYVDDCVELQGHLIKSPESVDQQRFIDTATDSHGYLIGIQDDDGTLVGLGLVSKIMDPVRVIAYVNNIVVQPEARGQGLFGLIMKDLENKARQWGCSKVELTCSRENVQRLYEKRGYQEKQTKYYILKL